MILRSLRKNLQAGVRLALFLPLRAFDYRASPPDYAALVAFNLLLWVAAAALRNAFQGEFDAGALLVYLASVPLVLGTAMLVALAYGAPERLLLIAVALTASDALFEVGGIALPYIAALSGAGASAFFLFFGWIWIVAMRAVVVCAGKQRPQLYQGVLAVTAMIALALFVFPKAEVWTTPEDAQDGAPLADERLFHRQGELIERDLAALQPGRPGVVETYFVGFAPDASQEAFLEELRQVKRAFEEGHGAAGRSLALASSYGALEQFPIASVTNLARTLARAGGAMNADEDVLFLFLWADADPEHRLAAWQPPLELTRLTPIALARMLQDAGIRWRVVVVSGCNSDGYREPLRDGNTMVVTAGCDAREAAAIGPAFLDAARQGRPAAEALAVAAKASNAQISVGEALGRKLNIP